MAVRPSPSVRRVASVLVRLASEPARDFSLSELARELGLSKASCHSLLLALVSDGLVTRRERARTYQLGPSLVYLGDAARSALVAGQHAIPELQALRDELGVTAVLGVNTPTDVLITAAVPAEHPLGLTIVPGTRNPLRAPMGSIYVAWSTEEVVAAWLDRGAAQGTLDRDRARRGVAAIRARGWSATVRRFVPVVAAAPRGVDARSHPGGPRRAGVGRGARRARLRGARPRGAGVRADGRPGVRARRGQPAARSDAGRGGGDRRATAGGRPAADGRRRRTTAPHGSAVTDPVRAGMRSDGDRASRAAERRRMATIGKRLLQIIPTVFLVTLATFLLVDLIPGDPAYAILGENATPEAVDALHHQLRLDDPLPVRYVHWLGDAVTGDLGTSIRSNRPVTKEFTERLPVTLELAVLAILIGLVLGIPLGMWSAWREGRLLDRATSTASFAVVSLPSFLLGVLLVYLLALRFEVFPVTGWERLSDGLGANLRHAFLPALALGLAEAAVFSQLLRVDMVATLHEDFVAAARAKGMPGRSILVHHALRPSSQSLLALAGVNFGRLLGGTVIVEQLFGLPGIGTLIITSIPSKDMPVVQGCVLVIAIGYVAVNLLVDITAVAVDPRLRRARH